MSGDKPGDPNYIVKTGTYGVDYTLSATPLTSGASGYGYEYGKKFLTGFTATPYSTSAVYTRADGVRQSEVVS